MKRSEMLKEIEEILDEYTQERWLDIPIPNIAEIILQKCEEKGMLPRDSILLTFGWDKE